MPIRTVGSVLLSTGTPRGAARIAIRFMSRLVAKPGGRDQLAKAVCFYSNSVPPTGCNLGFLYLVLVNPSFARVAQETPDASNYTVISQTKLFSVVAVGTIIEMVTDNASLAQAAGARQRPLHSIPSLIMAMRTSYASS